jgi:AAA domain, putative AbiEii toxin, Type IV TA system/AAA domain
MLKRIKIENLRGIREGEIEGLTRLVVLVGPNGSGKSTVLEGVFIGGSRYPAAAVGAITSRRTQTWNGARWLHLGGDSQNEVRTEVQWLDDRRIVRRVQWTPVLGPSEARNELDKIGAPVPYSALMIYRDEPLMLPVKDVPVPLAGLTAIAADNRYYPYEFETDLQTPSLRLVEPRLGQYLHDLFSRAVQGGKREDVVQSAKMVVAELEGIEILTEESEPRLFLTYKHGAVPASLAGDGIHALLRMAFELASPAGGTVLLEEPEVHMHPKASYACAKAIVAAVRRDVQVLLTTHSMELIDLLLAELTEDERADAGMMTVCRVQLRGGRLVSTLIAASDAVQARMALAEDLR